MGTDIHPVWWVKRNFRTASYYWPLRPPFHYTWYPDRLHPLNRDLGLNLKSGFRERGADEDWDLFNMQKQAEDMVWLSTNPAFIEANTALDSVSNRDYNFFAIIANVRNGSGFAGVDTGAMFEPIGSGRSSGRLPFDPRHDPSGAGERFNYGDHSFSWVTLKELLDYPWEKTRMATGVIPMEPIPISGPIDYMNSWRKPGDTYVNLRDGNKPPHSYSGGISGLGIQTISMAEADAILDGRRDREPDITYYVQYYWTLTNRESISSATYDGIHWLAQRVDPATTYLVFGFDS